MEKGKIVFGAATLLAASVSTAYSSGFGLSNLTSASTTASASADASPANQDQLVSSYVAADTQVLTAQAKMAEAVGLKDQAAQAQAAADAYGKGSTEDGMKNATAAQKSVSAGLDDAFKQPTQLSDASKATFVEGLKHLGAGTAQTVGLKSSAMAFGQQAKTQISSASMLDKLSVTKKLSSGMYVSENLPGHITGLLGSLHSAVSFAQSHDIPVPQDATAALSLTN